MKINIKKYHENFLDLIDSVKVTDKFGKKINFFSGIEITYNIIEKKARMGRKIIFIGNGGSAAIASHMATDFLKNKGIRSLVFNDSALLTCVSNDLGYEYVFQKPLEVFSDKDDVLFSISSSGKSKNIINAAKQAKRNGCYLVTLSGFNKLNPLRKLGDINFFVPSHKYGLVEVTHLYICHYIADMVTKK